ncbi:MAG: patatin-like phospholipase family protein [Myxococcota bacterium]
MSAVKELRVLYFCLVPDALEALAAELEAAGVSATWSGDDLVVEFDGVCLRLAHENDVSNVRTRLDREYISFVLVELRRDRNDTPMARRGQAVEDLITALDHASDVELRYGFHRIGLLISDEHDDPSLDSLLLSFGAQGIRLAWRSRPGEQGFARRALKAVSHAVSHRRVGKMAMCLSGGGTTGIYFELGVLKCLQDCLPKGAISEMDMYFGISAGAVVASLLAVGYSVDEFMAAVAGENGTRMPPVDLKLVRRHNYDGARLRRRFIHAATQAAQKAGLALVRRRPSDPQALAPGYRSLWAAPFTAEALEQYLREAFEVPGASNRFDQLDRALFVGATDLDSRRPTLFGSNDSPPATISKAVQASVSFNPVFGPVKIGERFYEDGAVTRTSNMSEAIERGATLVLVVDPYVPRVARKPGAHAGRSMFYHVDQNLRTMSFTRFANARKWVVRRHPDVGLYSFVPSNRQRRLVADNPMDHRAYALIWKGAYLSTLARLERCWPKLAGDLDAHGVPGHLGTARIVARQLEQVELPTLADFYPDRQLETHLPPLTLDRQRQRLE